MRTFEKGKIYHCASLYEDVEFDSVSHGYAAVWLSSTGERVIVEEDDLYEYVPELVSKVCGYPICYEHNEDIDYPYYCPMLEENLYEFETRQI